MFGQNAVNFILRFIKNMETYHRNQTEVDIVKEILLLHFEVSQEHIRKGNKLFQAVADEKGVSSVLCFSL